MSDQSLTTTAPGIVRHDSAQQRTAQPAGWKFWLPLAIVWLALYSVEQSSYFASADFLEKGDGNRVVEATSSSSALRQLSIVILGGLGAALLAVPASVPIVPRWGMLFVVVLTCSMLIVSATWAEDEMLSLKRAVQPILLMVAALGLAKHLQPRQLCKFAALVAGSTLLLGVSAVLVHGTFWQGAAYRFSGTLHPNAQAVNCAALGLASLALFSDERQSYQRRWPWLLGFVIGVAFLLMTRSRTTTAAFGVGIWVYFFVGAPALRKCALTAMPALLIACCIVFVMLPETGVGEVLTGAAQMGRGDENMTSLTGRLPIWQAVLRDIGEHPILGYGYGSFWITHRVWEYSFIHRWEFNHAHSAYFETMLNVGFVGVLLGLLVTLSTVWFAAQAYRATRDVGYRFIVAMVAVALVQGLIDSNFVMVGFAPLLIMMCVATIVLRSELVAEPQAMAGQRSAIPSNFRTALNY